MQSRLPKTNTDGNKNPCEIFEAMLAKPPMKQETIYRANFDVVSFFSTGMPIPHITEHTVLSVNQKVLDAAKDSCEQFKAGLK